MRRLWHLPRRALGLCLGCCGLAALSACASGGGQVAQGPSTNYYIQHAAASYQPPGPPSDPWGPYINIASSRFDVPQQWIRQVMRVESGGNEYIDGQLTVSAAGAMGLMQLEPQTYQEMAAQYGLGADPFNPYNNIMAGTAYIHEMYDVYGSPGFLAAYNAGPGRLDAYVHGQEPLPQQTINYVAMIAPNIQGYYPVHRSEADEMALNTLPASEFPGILPPGFVPEAPTPQSLTPSPPVQMAELTPDTGAASAVYEPNAPASAPPVTASALTPAPVVAQPIAATPLPPPPAPPPSFSIIPAAMADTPPPTPAPTPEPTGWAIQVGAYDSPSNARAALGMAELTAVQMLVNGQAVVMSVQLAGRTEYRARVINLPREDALNACSRLASGPTGCIVLSPDAQS